VRRDLDRLMQQRGLAGMVVLAHDHYSPAMHYATGQKIVHGLYFRSADGRAHLIHDPMERDQAAKVGCAISGYPQHGLVGLVEKEGSQAKALGRIIGETCATLGIRGAVALYGETGLSTAWQMVGRALEVNPELQVDATQPDVLSLARATKDDDEIEAIRTASVGTVAAMKAVRDTLASLRRAGDAFHAPGIDRPVTLGDLRKVVHRVFAEHGLAEDGESIIAQGRDAGVPHNRGNDDDVVRAGQSIIVDLFPGEAGGGYHSDMTRTFCVGKAPAPLKHLFDEVLSAYHASMEAFRVGERCRAYQDLVCERFEKAGHETRRTNDAVSEGYVHNLGHGIGLSVHEAPLLGGAPGNPQVVEDRMAITVEPGLYYPSKGMGVRVEDLVIARAGGRYENLTPFPYDLEVEPLA
jgi:Xaa-Pro aminopeptidase